MKRLLFTSLLMFATQPALSATVIQCQSQITSEMKTLGLGSVWPAPANIRAEISPTNIGEEDEKIKQDPDLQRADKIIRVAQPEKPYPRVYVLFAQGVPFKMIEFRQAPEPRSLLARGRAGFNKLNVQIDKDCKMSVTTDIYDRRFANDSLNNHLQVIAFCNRLQAEASKTTAERLYIAGEDCAFMRQPPAQREKGLEDIRSVPGSLSEGLEIDPNG